jgi:soluble lytic murein transglycosylase
LFSLEVGNYKKYYFYCREICLEKDIDVSLVLAVIKTESSFDENAVSSKGAIGLMQLMPSTANYIAKKVNFNERIDLFNPQTNLYLGICYLEYLIKKYDDERVVLASYNAGETRVKSWITNGELNIPIKETKNYIKRVNRRRKLYDILI